MPVTSNIPWNFTIDREQSLVPQIVNHVEHLINTSQLVPGQRIISKDAYSKLLNVSKKTMENAYSVLKAKKLTESQSSSGTFVKFNIPGAISFKDPVPAYTHNRVQMPKWRPAVPYLSVGLHRPQSLLNHMDRYMRNYKVSGFDHLVLPKQINRYLSEILLYRNVEATKEQIGVIHGAGRNLNVVALTLLKPGDTVVMTSPEDKNAFAAFGLRNAKLLYTGSDVHGMQVGSLRRICNRHKIKALFIRPASDYTMGTSTTRARRQEIMNLALKHDFVIIETYNEHEFWAGEEVGTFWQMGHYERVIYLSPASVITNNYNALSLIIAPSQFIKAACEYAEGFSTPDLNLEKLLIHTVQDSTYSRAIEEALRIDKKCRQENKFLLDNYLSDHVRYSMPDAGHTVWLELHKPVNPGSIFKDLEVYGMYPSISSRSRNIKAIRLGLGAPLKSQEKVCKLISNLLSVSAILVMETAISFSQA
ncbi:MAG TPA: hypothetical protein VGD90_02035 [Sphingobacteriaceae bacterium]